MSDRTQAFADPITRADLELESHGDPSATVFASFSQPHTSAGVAALRARLAAPCTNLHEIRFQQDAVRDCVKTFARFEHFVDQARPERVRRYLNSQIEVPRVAAGVGGLLSFAWTAARHAECLAIAREGRECVTAFAAACGEWVAESAAMRESSLLKALAGRLEVFPRLIGDDLAGRGPGAVDCLRIDAVFRGRRRPTIEAALELLGQLDALHALAATGVRNGWPFPMVREGPPHLVIEGLRHPLVASPVENDVRLESERGMLLLTGPNMAGKTTYLKSIGIAVYLAQVGMAVPARRMELVPFDRLVTVIGIHDTVASGSSAFHYEVTRLGQGLDALLAGNRCLLLFDELMRGTNATDALESCRLVIDALSGSENGCAVLATHLAGLVDLFAGDPRLTLGHFEAETKDDRLVYDYRLRPGGYQGRMAMALLDQMGVTAKLASLRGEPAHP